jgi:hypothetical protein
VARRAEISASDEAEKLVGAVEDAEVQKQVRELRNRVDSRYADNQLKACERHLEMEDFESAEKIIVELRPLLHHLDDTSTGARRMLLENTISLIKDLQLQRTRVLKGEYRLAYEAHKGIASRASGVVTTAPNRLARALHEDLQTHLEELAGQYWKDAEKARKNGKYEKAISAYRWMALVRQDQDQHKKASALEFLAMRYRELPPPVVDEPKLSRLVQTTASFVTMMHETEAERNQGAQAIVSDWLVELCQALTTEPGVYESLAHDIRDLMQSAAISFAWSDRKFKQAAKEMMTRAIPSLRQQGLFIEALDMAQTFRQAIDAQIKAELLAPNAASSFLPVVESLYPAERQALVEMLARRTEELGDTLPSTISRVQS